MKVTGTFSVMIGSLLCGFVVVVVAVVVVVVVVGGGGAAAAAAVVVVVFVVCFCLFYCLLFVWLGFFGGEVVVCFCFGGVFCFVLGEEEGGHVSVNSKPTKEIHIPLRPIPKEGTYSLLSLVLSGQLTEIGRLNYLKEGR